MLQGIIKPTQPSLGWKTKDSSSHPIYMWVTHFKSLPFLGIHNSLVLMYSIDDLTDVIEYDSIYQIIIDGSVSNMLLAVFENKWCHWLWQLSFSCMLHN